MAFGRYGGARASEHKLFDAAEAVLAAETVEQVIALQREHGGRIGYTPLGYMIKLREQGTDDPAEMVEIVSGGWDKDESPFTLTTTSRSGSGPKEAVTPEPEPVDPELAYLMGL